MTALFRRLFHGRAFDIRLWFVVVALVVILIVNTLSALLLSNYMTRSLIRREGEVAQEFLNSIVRAENSGVTLFDRPAPSEALQSFSNHVRKLPGMLRANIYSPDYFIRFSTSPDMEGRKFADNEELRQAFEGKLIANLEDVDDAEKPEHIALDTGGGDRIVEAYIPVVGDDGKTVAVVEFYRNTENLRAIIANLSLIIWTSAGLGGLLLFAALYGAVARGSRLIERQKHEIGEMSALAAVGQMASAVAHSLRNPLASIQSSTELLRLQHPHIAADVTVDIMDEVERMNQHVHELLTYSRSAAASGQRLNFSHLVRRVLAKNEAALSRRGIDLGFEVRQAAEVEVMLDPMMFGQVVASLLSNASEAMPDGGAIDVEISLAPDRQSVLMRVADTGRGIPPEVLSQLPSPFVTTKTRGLGLGLTLAKRIVERFGGDMRIASQPDRGTTVEISLPIQT